MPDESFADRLAALKDIVPPTYRKTLSNTFSTTSSWVQTTLNYGGKTLWVVSTSVLLLGVPWALAFAEEQQMAEMEREMKMQQSANEVSLGLLTSATHPSKGILLTKRIAPHSAATIAGQARSVNGSVSFFLCIAACLVYQKICPFFSSLVQLYLGGGGWTHENAIDFPIQSSRSKLLPLKHIRV